MKDAQAMLLRCNRQRFIDKTVDALTDLENWAKQDNKLMGDIYTCLNHTDNEYQIELSELIELLEGIRK